jgi:hypothetical protein
MGCSEPLQAVVLAAASPCAPAGGASAPGGSGGGGGGGGALGAGMLVFAGGANESVLAWDLRAGQARPLYELSTGAPAVGVCRL